MHTDIDNNIKKAIEDFGFRSSVPIFKAIEGDDADHLATGTFIRSQDRLFLLTARHILDDCNPADLAIARAPEGSRLQTLGISNVFKPIDDSSVDVDILCIEIKEPEVHTIVNEGWRAVDIAIGKDPELHEDVLLVGYPSATLKKDGMKLSGKPTSYRTSVMETIPLGARQPVKDGLDIFLALDREGVSFSGERFCSPAIGGMSGCAIWQFADVQDAELWTPDRALRLVGIQASASPGQFFRGKQWRYIEQLICQACHST
ncbi:hypothetical protein F9K85_17780 [Brucella tritici]|uniref:hypothetical protein n=1 Tax=Brucella tritici TaxID=94626 RepID=UPI00124F24CE|nr:hypothetical protein [Brucella tritici]KAB2674217.1 hypothetical protein F9K85_17780 [Brucella tritici]